MIEGLARLRETSTNEDIQFNIIILIGIIKCKLKLLLRFDYLTILIVDD
jgi:hypothetical protein